MVGPLREGGGVKAGPSSSSKGSLGQTTFLRLPFSTMVHSLAELRHLFEDAVEQIDTMKDTLTEMWEFSSRPARQGCGSGR